MGTNAVQADIIYGVDHGEYNVKMEDGEVLNVETEELQEYMENEEVEYIEPNRMRTMMETAMGTTPNDPYFSLQWYLAQSNDADIDAKSAWDTETGSSDVVVAIIDTGADMDHVDLVDNFWVNPNEIANNGIDDDNNGYIDDINGWNFIDDNNNLYPVPDGSGSDFGVNHGTHVAGTVGATGNNGIGVTGVNWSTSLMILKVLDDEGVGDTYGIAQAIRYAQDNGADIINMSLGAYTPASIEREATEDAIDSGIMVMAALGNDGVNVNSYPIYPACYSKVMGVAATNASDEAASFTNYGTDCADISAPGVNIYSTLFVDGSDDFNSPYGYMSGTSMATPVVAGVAALLKSNLYAELAASIKDAIRGSADDVGLGTGMGTGRINASAALEALQESVRPTRPKKIQAYTGKKKKHELDRNTRTNERTPYFQWKKGDKSDSIAGYYVYWGTKKKADPYTKGVFRTGRSFQPGKKLSGNNKVYYLRVKSVNTVGNVSSGLRKFKYIIDTKVDRPVQIDPESLADGVLVRWFPVEKEHVTGYYVYRWNSSKNKYVRLDSHKTANTYYYDKTVEKGKTYKYKVRSVDDLGNRSSLSKRKKINY